MLFFYIIISNIYKNKNKYYNIINFKINNKAFNYIKDDNNNTIINSYNKKYNIYYNKKQLTQLISEIYIKDDFIFIDKNVYNLDKTCLNNIDEKYYFIFDAVEQNKTIEYVFKIIDMLLELKFNKKNKLIVIGGGITQDVGGFVSAIYKRGIKWIFIPTTLLSMTDSAIGGKVSINRDSKNMLGLFSSPDDIYISEYFLKSLSDDDIISGLGEALKLCIIAGENEYNYFKENVTSKNYTNIIKISSSIKKTIVEYDEFDKNERKILNYGHTIGHALESTSNYFIPHGIAVLFGIYIKNKLFYGDKYNELNNYILSLIPNKFKNINLSYNIFLEHIINDKKNDGDKICFIILNDFGDSSLIYKGINEISDMEEIFNKLFL